MSIINEALKKVELSLEKNIPRAPKAGIKINRYLIYGLLFAFGLFLEDIFFSYLLHPQARPSVSEAPLLVAQNSPPAPQEPPVQPPPQADDSQEVGAWQPPPFSLPVAEENQPPVEETALVLNGTFFSRDDGYYALINNKIVKEGDDIEGSVVKKIELNGVELESEGGKLVKLSKDR